MMKTVKIYNVGKYQNDFVTVVVCVLGVLKTLVQKYIRTIPRWRKQWKRSLAERIALHKYDRLF